MIQTLSGVTQQDQTPANNNTAQHRIDNTRELSRAGKRREEKRRAGQVEHKFAYAHLPFLLPVSLRAYAYAYSSLTPKTETTPSPLTETSCLALSPQPTATDDTELRNGSDHFLELLAYCCTVMPLDPAVARNWPV